MIEVYINTETQLEVEAVQLDKENSTAISDWCKGLEVIEHDAVDLSLDYVGVNVPTRMGMRRASQGDFVVKSWTGFEVYKPIRFKMNHVKKGN